MQCHLKRKSNCSKVTQSVQSQLKYLGAFKGSQSPQSLQRHPKHPKVPKAFWARTSFLMWFGSNLDRFCIQGRGLNLNWTNATMGWTKPVVWFEFKTGSQRFETCYRLIGPDSAMHWKSENSGSKQVWACELGQRASNRYRNKLHWFTERLTTL